MTIIASNSLTLSNVNDGTITHTAYAYSADGTDGFATVYPNLNLLKNTRTLTATSTSSVWDTLFSSSQIYDSAIKSKSGVSAMNFSFSVYVPLNAIVGSEINIQLKGQTYQAWGNVGTDDFNTIICWVRFIVKQNDLGKTIRVSSPVELGAKYQSFDSALADTDSITIRQSSNISGFVYSTIKLETGSTATPYMPSASEVTTADWPSYIGQYTDFTQADSTNPSNYTWSLMRGNDGKDGTNGTDGDPGKVVSDIEPTTRFKGLTWKYSGTTDLTASDGTVIHPNTEYYYNGTHWMINYLSANNLEANSITADLIDGKNLTITDGEFVSTTTNGPVTTSTEIKDNHIAISKTDGTVNTRNDIALDSEQGLAQKFTNINTGFYRTAGINYQGPFTSDSDGNYAQLTPQGTKLSTDVPWTDITRASGVGTSGTLRARINNGVFYAQSKDVTIPSIAPNSLITIGTMSSKFSGVSGFDTLGLLYSPGQLSVASVTVGNDGKINIGNPNPTTMSGKVIQFSINIPLG